MSSGFLIGNLARLWPKYGKNLPRFVLTFLDNRRVFIKGGTPRRGPLVAVFNMSPACDSKCVFCDYWKKTVPPEKTLSTEGKVTVIRKLAAAGVWLLSFCSAEPLIVEDIDTLIAEAKKRGMLINVSTNGSRLEEKAEMLVRFGVDNVTVSIDSHEAAVHDQLRGYPGLFQRIEKGVDRLRALRKGRKPWITARHLVNGKTCFRLKEFITHWSDRVDDIILKPIFESPSGMFHIPDDMKVRAEDEGRFREYFDEILRTYPSIDKPYHRLVPDHLFGHAPAVKEYYCFAGSFFADIDNEGRLCPCGELGRRFGDLVGNDFLDIWTSDDMAEFRRSLKKRKRCENCWGDKFLAGMVVQQLLEFMGGMDDKT